MPYSRFEDAIQMHQGGPGNLRGLSRSLVTAVDAATSECGSTMATWRDPAVRAIILYLADLVGVGPMDTIDYPALMDECRSRAADAVHP